MSAQTSDLKDSVVAKLVDDRRAEWEGTAQPLDNLKKSEMATEAVRLV